MIDRVAFAFQNPVFIFDAGFHLIAYTKKYIKNDHFEKFLIENGELTNEAFEILNKQNNIHEKVKRSETPVLVFHPELGFEQLVCTLDTQKRYRPYCIKRIITPFLRRRFKITTHPEKGDKSANEKRYLYKK